SRSRLRLQLTDPDLFGVTAVGVEVTHQRGDDSVQFAGVPQPRRLPQPHQNPVPGLTRLVAVRLRQRQILVRAVVPAHLRRLHEYSPRTIADPPPWFKDCCPYKSVLGPVT